MRLGAPDLDRDVARSDSFVARFQREVETIAQLSHPNIVMAFDADEADVYEQKRALAQPWLEGA